MKILVKTERNLKIENIDLIKEENNVILSKNDELCI